MIETDSILIDRHEYSPDTRISEHFEWREFVCKCGRCAKQKMSPLLFPKLEELRSALGNRSITITSGYRCPDHNDYVQGAPQSRHLLGQAADIKVFGRDTIDVAKAADRLGFGGVKRYRSWVHVDVRQGARWVDLG